MTNLVLMIMPLVGGYWFLSNCNRTKYMAYGYTGYRLFFGSAFFGIVFLICAKLILSTMSAISTINYIIGCISEWLIPTGFNLESTLAMIIGIASPYMFYSSIYKDKREICKRKWAKRAAENRGHFLQIRIFEANSKGQLIELAMQNGEVYIGYVTILGRLDNEYISLNPCFSGYRDEKTKNLIITRDYLKVLLGSEEKKENSKNPINLTNLSITLKMSEVATAQLFYPEFFAEIERLREGSNSQS